MTLREKYDRIIGLIEEFVEFGEPDIPEAVSREMGLNLRLLGDAFQFITDMTIIQYIRKRKLVHALSVRMEQGLSIYQNTHHFQIYIIEIWQSSDCHIFTQGGKLMSTNQITSKIEALLEWEKIMAEAKEEADALRDEIKQEMLLRNTEELSAGQYIVRWTSVLSQRFDATAFKKTMPEVYRSFLKQVTSRRFHIA